MEGALIEDTTVRIDADEIPAIQAKTVADDVDSGVLACRGTEIEGNAAGNQTVVVTDRDDCVFENLSIHQTGRRRNGLYFERSVDNELSDSRIDVTGDPIVLRQADLERANTDVESRADNA
jgi:polygalacturonase